MNKQIEQVIESLKIRSSNGQNSFKIFQFGGEPVDVTCKFYPAATVAELKKLKTLGLPSDYIDFLRLTNGLELFDQGGSMGVVCHIYPVQEVFQERDFMRNNDFFSEEDLVRTVPILRLRDIGEMYIDRIKYIDGENYLSYPLPDNDYFKFSFAEWLERFIVCEGNEFWYFLNP